MKQCTRCLHETVCERWLKLAAIWQTAIDQRVPKEVDVAVATNCKDWLCCGILDALKEYETQKQDT